MEIINSLRSPTLVVYNISEIGTLFWCNGLAPFVRLVLRYCRNVRPTWVKFDSKDTKESEWVFEVLSTKSKKRT